MRLHGGEIVEVKASLLLHERTKNQWHHCFSQGMPSKSPSISTPGQFLRKKVASAQEVI